MQQLFACNRVLVEDGDKL